MELNLAEQIREEGSELSQLSMSGELLILVCFYIFFNFSLFFPITSMLQGRSKGNKMDGSPTKKKKKNCPEKLREVLSKLAAFRLASS